MLCHTKGNIRWLTWAKHNTTADHALVCKKKKIQQAWKPCKVKNMNTSLNAGLQSYTLQEIKAHTQSSNALQTEKQCKTHQVQTKKTFAHKNKNQQNQSLQRNISSRTKAAINVLNSPARKRAFVGVECGCV